MSEDEKDDYIKALEKRNEELTTLFVKVIEQLAYLVGYLVIMVNERGDTGKIHVRWLLEKSQDLLHEIRYKNCEERPCQFLMTTVSGRPSRQ